MGTVVRLLLGFVTGFLAGVLLSEMIGIVGMLAFDRALGIKYLPVATGLVAAAVAALSRSRQRS